MKFLLTSIVVFTIALTAFLSLDNSVNAASISQVVTEAQIVRQAENTAPTKNWVLYTRNAGSGVFRTGPNPAPLGLGSLEFSTPTASDKVFLFNYDHVTTRLADITAIGYSTFISSVNPQEPRQVAALNIQVDSNGPEAAGGFTTLVYEPVYNATVMAGQWQNWDAYSGGSGLWWSTQPINGMCSGATAACDKTWAEIVANNPDAVILGGFGINQGSGNPDLVSAVDKLMIGYDGDLITYNFEPLVVATTKDQCKAGGWAFVSRSDDSLFNNQGDCVSYVNTGN